MDIITPGKFVALAYKLYAVNLDGTETLMAEYDAKDPETIIYGVTEGVIRPLESELEGKKAGDHFDIVVKSDEAFGPYSPENVVELDRSIFTVDGKFDDQVVKIGAYVPMMTAEGMRINGKVLDITADKVRLDFNHPLAGKDVRFQGEVTEVRDATPEELHPATGCGCHCDHAHDDACSCDDGCGCH